MERGLYLQSSDASRILLPRLDEKPQDDEAGSKHRWLCKRCSAVVTSEDQSLVIDGRHVHRRTNPHGFEFELGCFQAAPGVTTTGLPTSEHSWFVGYRWSFALCRRCSGHLGWFFSGSKPAFHGLILKLLVAEKPFP